MSSPTPGSEFVTETMALVLRIESRKLGQVARGIYEAAEQGNATIHVPAMTFAEILYLSEKGRITANLAAVAAYFKANPACKELPMSRAVVEAAGQITDIPELHDRLIAGSARLLNLPLITNDPDILASAFVTAVW